MISTNQVINGIGGYSETTESGITFKVDLTDYAKKTELTNKADKVHEHNMSDVVNLEESIEAVNKSLEGKADVVHTHERKDVDGLNDVIKEIQDNIELRAKSGHVHQTSEVVGLNDTLASKADATHSHQITDVEELSDTLVNHQTAIETLALSSEAVTGIKAINYKHNILLNKTGYNSVPFILDITAQNYYFDGKVQIGGIKAWVKLLIIEGNIKYLIHKNISTGGIDPESSEYTTFISISDTAPNQLNFAHYLNSSGSTRGLYIMGIGNIPDADFGSYQINSSENYNKSNIIVNNSRYKSTDYYGLQHEISDINGLNDTLVNHQTAIEALSSEDVTHTHQISEVEGLSDTLANHQTAIEALNSEHDNYISDSELYNYSSSITEITNKATFSFQNPNTFVTYENYNDYVKLTNTVKSEKLGAYHGLKVQFDDSYCLYYYESSSTVPNLDIVGSNVTPVQGSYNLTVNGKTIDGVYYVYYDPIEFIVSNLYNEAKIIISYYTSKTEWKTQTLAISTSYTKEPKYLTKQALIDLFYPVGSIYMIKQGDSLPSNITALGEWQYLGYVEIKNDSSTAATTSTASKIAFYQKG